MRIVICDDDAEFANELKLLIEKGSAALDIHPEFLVYNCGESVISDIPRCDAIFLDIDMPDVNGFEIAHKINKTCDTFIIFVTSYDELVYSSIKFRPFRFIRKSHLDNELPEVLNALASAVVKRAAGRRFKLHTKMTDVFLNVDEIKYMETFGHWIRVYMSGAECIECYGSLSDMEKQLSELDFVRIHKSYLVNCRYVYSIERGRVILTDKTELPLSRYKSDQVKSKVRNYILSEL